MKKTAWILLLAAILLCGCAAPEVPVETVMATLPQTHPTTEPTTEPTTAPTTQPEPEPEHFLLTFVGDCTLGNTAQLYYGTRGFVNVIGDDYRYPFRNVIDYFETDEFTMVNLEGVLGMEGYAVEKTFNFRGPAEFVNILTENSVEAVTIANNHSLDYGRPGYDETKRILEEAGVPYVEKDASTMVTTPNGLKIGLYAGTFTIKMEDLKEEVAALREAGADIVVLAAHWGEENAYNPSTHQRDMAYAAIDAGVDIVYGHHPHVLQKIEAYNGGIIFYSLGNFSFGGNTGPKDFDTALVQQEVIRDPDGTVTLGELTVIPCSISSERRVNNYQPTPYEPGSEAYERTMKKLGFAPAAGEAPGETGESTEETE